MSKQLKISAIVSVFAMATFAFGATTTTAAEAANTSAAYTSGATTQAAAPAFGQ